MGEALDAIREIVTLTENVRGLRDDVARVAVELKDLNERLVRLEAREELIVEKTRNAAIIAVSQMSGQLLERVMHLERSQPASSAKANSTDQPLLKSGSGVDS